MDAAPTPRIEELLQHARWVEELARRVARDPATADDVAQSAWLAVMRTRAAPTTNVRAWLARVVQNVARQEHRRDARRADVEHGSARGEALPSAQVLAARADAERRLVEHVLALEEPHRHVLLLRYFEGLAPEEIARREGIRTPSVSQRITRAHQKLRERLAASEGSSWLGALAPILSAPTAPPTIDGRGAERANPSDPVPPSRETAPSRFATSTTMKLILPVACIAVAAAWLSWPEAPRTLPNDERVALVASTGANVPPREEKLAATSDRSPVAPPADVARAEAALPSAPRATDAQASATSTAADKSGAASVTAGSTGGRIHGRVFRPDGSPALARKVRLFHTPRGPQVFAVTDDAGVFDQRDLAAGTWAVSTAPSKEERAAIGLEPDPTYVEFMAQRSVVLADGAEVEIELGAPSPTAVRAHGRIVGVDPAALVMVHWVPSAADGLDRGVYTPSRPDGTYVAILDGPGAYTVSAILPGPVRMERSVVVTEREFEHDLVAPSGRIHGRVLDDSGAPVAGASVDLTPRAGHKPLQFQASFAFIRTTGDDGRFEFALLESGEYALGVRGGKRTGATALGSRALRRLTVESGAPERDIDVVLAPGVPVRGRVQDPVKNDLYYTNVFVFDEAGEPVNAIAPATSDKAGTFELAPLSPGRYSLVGAHGDQWTNTGTLDVRAGETPPEIELVLAPAAKVIVTGEELGDAWIDVRDARGNCLSAVLDKNLFTGGFGRGLYVDRWVYALPEGNYVVKAVGSTGVVATARVAAIAGETQTVTLAR